MPQSSKIANASFLNDSFKSAVRLSIQALTPSTTPQILLHATMTAKLL